MKQMVIVGVDVSKLTLDIYFKPSSTFLQITNNAAGFTKWLVALQNQVYHQQSVLVIMEHTGRYSSLFESFLQKQGIGYCKIPALQIKRSIGVVRGKNDKVDAERIAEYGWLRKDMLRADEVLEPEIENLQSLLGLRAKMVRDRAGYKGRLKEMLYTGSYKKGDMEALCQERIIKVFDKEIMKIETQIKLLISSSQALKTTNELLQSIGGVGWVVAAFMICSTGNFKKFSSARKFNCYAGLAPFKYESGTSIRGRSRVSHLANKQAKTILNLAAFTAIKHDPELKQYYERRVKEGKRKMSCINIVRAKLVSRMFAVAKRQSPYYQIAA
jgi:transposase